MSEQVTLFTKAEVAANNGQNNTRLWMVINNGVYDLTDFMHQHPGGVDLLLEYGGKDGTRAFNESGHSSSAKNMMKPYKIGLLAQEQKLNEELRNTNKTFSSRRIFLRIICGKCLT